MCLFYTFISSVLCTILSRYHAYIQKKKKTQTYINNGIFESRYYVLFLTIFCSTEGDNFRFREKNPIKYS